MEKRYRRHSTIVATNLVYDRWPNSLGSRPQARRGHENHKHILFSLSPKKPMEMGDGQAIQVPHDAKRAGRACPGRCNPHRKASDASGLSVAGAAETAEEDLGENSRVLEILTKEVTTGRHPEKLRIAAETGTRHGDSQIDGAWYGRSRYCAPHRQ